LRPSRRRFAALVAIILGYFLPTDFAGPTNGAMGLIDFSTLASYEQYRRTLANDSDHRKNIARLEQSGVAASMERSIIQIVAQD
jgi:NIPSNAP